MKNRLILSVLALMGAMTAVPAMAQSDLSITKTGPSSVQAGQNVTYKITAQSLNEASSDNVVISDPLPTGTTFVSASQNSGPLATLTQPTVGTGGTFGANISSLATISKVKVNSFNFASFGGSVYFSSYDTATGSELWKSDGTIAGTTLVKDIYPGSGGSTPHDITASSDALYFSSYNGLWKSDGTTAGTVLVKGDMSTAELAMMGNTLYFQGAAYNGGYGMELWKSDGTAAGTVMVKDIVPGSNGSFPSYMKAVGNTLFFSSGGSLWKSDGTSEGTVMLKSGGNAYSLTSFQGNLYFQSSDSAHGYELWKSDGTAAGTVLVKDIVPGVSGSSPSNLVVMNDVLYFGASGSLWKTDGTSEGTVQIKNSVNPIYTIAVGNTLYFRGTDATYGTELWKSDGTAEGTVLVKDLIPGSGSSSPAYLKAVGDTFYFNITNSTNSLELWKSDGTAEGTLPVLRAQSPAVFYVTVATSPYATGTLSNTATISTTSTEANLDNNSATATTTLVPPPMGDLKVTKTAPGSVQAGQNMTYTINVTNSGPVALSNVVVSDALPAGTTFVSATNASSSFYNTSFYLTTPPVGQNGTIRATANSFAVPEGIYSPQAFTPFGGLLYFGANGGLWKTDGTLPGTVYVGVSANSNLTAVGDTLYFTSSTFGSFSGPELWRSDGTAGGTVLIKSVGQGFYSPSSTPPSLINFKGTLYFLINQSPYGAELWKSDGTAAGTVRVKAMSSTFVSFNNTAPGNLTVVGDTLYFSANDGINGIELWKSDGTAAGTMMVKDLAPGSTNSTLSSFNAFNGSLYFAANGGLWKSDGTDAGTVLIKAGVSPAYLTTFNGALYFQANDGSSGAELWKSDGTPEGTTLAVDIVPGATGSTPAYLTVAGNTLFFSANNGTNGIELWKSDGTAAGTLMVKDINVGAGSSTPARLAAFGDSVYFSGSSYLWKSDGTPEGTVQFRASSATFNIVVRVNSTTTGTLTNTATATGNYDSDQSNNSATVTTTVIPPSPSDLRVIKTAPPAGKPGDNLTYKLRAQVLGSNPAYDVTLSDTLPPGTTFVSATQTHGPAFTLTKPAVGSGGTFTAKIGTLISDTKFQNPYFFTEFNGAVYFRAYNSATGTELWKSDGTDVGTELVKDIVAGTGSSTPTYLTVFNGSLYFHANGGLWKSDGTEAGTVLVKSGLNGYYMAVAGNTLYLDGSDSTHGKELWKSDGTTAGTVMVKDISPGTNDSYISPMVALGNTLFFPASDGTNGTELWKSDGTEAGTVMVKDIYPGSNSSSPGYLKVLNGQLYFSASDSINGTELWKSDGTVAGTVLVKDIAYGPRSSSPYYMAVCNGALYFNADKGFWKSDGSDAGTVLVKSNFTASYTTAVGNTLYFTASDSTHASELWKSDGTEAGTVMIKDIYPGSTGSFPQNITAVGNLLYFAASSPTTALIDSGVTELWTSDGTEAGTLPLRSAISATFDIVVKVNNGVEGIISNTAMIGSLHAESDPSNNSSTAITRMPPALSVSLSNTSPQTKDILTATPTVIPAEGNYSYTYVWTVTHNGTPTVVQTTTDSTAVSDSLNLETEGNGDKGDSISVKVIATETGSGAVSAPASATATVVGSLPTADGSFTLKEDVASVLTLGNDVDGDPYTVQLTSLPTHGTLHDGSDANAPVIIAASVEAPYSLTGTDTNLNKVFFVPEANYNGSDSFDIQVSDGTTTSAVSPQELTITPVNDAPSFLKGTDQVVLDNAAAQSVTGWATALNAGAANETDQMLDFLVSNDNNALFAVQPAISAAGILSYKPQKGVFGSATVTVKIHDNGGVENDGVDTSEAQNFTITVNESDSTAPTVTQTTPFSGQKMLISAFKSGTLTGTATDNIGVSNVKVRITRLRSGVTQIWNGSAFTTASATVPATLVGSGKSVGWKLDSQFPPAVQLDEGQYIILVYATDAQGNTGSVTTRINLYAADSEIPVNQVFTPALNQKVLLSDFTSGAANAISGNATDNIGVNGLKLRFSRKRNGVNQYWNGSAFTTSGVFLNATLATVGGTSSKWNLDSQMPALSDLDSGLYQLEAYAVDIAGNKSTTVVRPFTLGTDFTAPSVVIVAPTQGQKIALNNFGTGTVNGTAADNLGVTSVKLKLQRKRGTIITYWNGSEFTTTAATVDATITSVDSTNVTWKLDNAPTVAQGLDTGAYTLYASAYDAAGNTKSSASRSFTLSAPVASDPVPSGSSAGRS